MTIDNKTIKYILAAGVLAAITVLFFMGGYCIGLKNGGGMGGEYVAAASVTAVPEASPEPERFRLILEDGELRLYSDEGGISRLISGEEISEAAFPARDVATLKEGVLFDECEDALKLMENFLS